jgi:2-polyprenyl-3-methyl-5-hydroxy-6-metoxy-1,4-benzoquinol methylase
LINQKNILNNTEDYLNTIDYSLTGEVFNLKKNNEYDLLVTQPIPENLDKYYEFDEYISHTDDNKSLIDKVYQLVRNYTLKKKLKLINSQNTKTKKILDIGCGTGDFLSICKNNSWTTIGVEPNKKAREISLTKNLVVKESINDIIKINQKFDVITLWHVLEHVPNLGEYIIQLKKLLTDNGTLIIAVPNYKSYDAIHYKEFWAAYDVPRHIWHFSKNSIEKLFKENEMSLVKFLPMKFDSYYVSLLSEKYKTGKMNPINAFFIGLKSNLKAKTSKEYSSLIYLLKKEV